MVTKVADGCAYVRFERHAICDKCGICDIDADSVHVVCRMKDALGAHTGDYVEVDMQRRRTLLSRLIYLVPLVLTVTGLFVGGIFSPLATAIGAVAGLVAGLAIAIPLDLLVLRRKCAPKMLRFVSPDSNGLSDDAHRRDTSFEKRQ